MIKRIPIQDIHINPDNPRKIDKGKLKKLQKSIKEFPQMLELRPIIIDETGMILGGNMRYTAAKNIGMDEVPCITTEDLTDQQKEEFIVKDNVSFGEWDWDILANQYDITELDDWSVDLPDYLKPQAEQKEYEELEEDGFNEDPDEIDIEVKEGDLIIFSKGEQVHKLYIGDSTKSESWVRLMGTDKGHMIYTDPPYGVSYTGQHHKKGKVWDMIENDELRQDDLYNLLKDSFNLAYDYTYNDIGTYCWHAGKTSVVFMTALQEANFTYYQQLIWNKGMTMGRTNYHWTHEPCLYLKKKNQTSKWYGDRKQKTILTNHFDPTTLSKGELVKIIQELQQGSTNWEIRKDAHIHYIHPTQKPIELAGRAIQNSSQEGEIVLDFFSGSGSTLLATHKLNRNFRGMELDPKYGQLIMNRIEVYDPDINIEIIHHE